MKDEMKDVVSGEEIPEEPQGNYLGGIQTLPKLQSEETDSEKLCRIEAVLDKICSRLGDEEDSIATYENMVQYFNSLRNSTEKLIRNLDKEVEYTRSLEDKLNRKEKERENLTLKKRLDEDHAKLILIYEQMKSTSDENFAAIRREIETLENDFQEKYSKVDDKVNELKELETTVEGLIANFRDCMIKASDNEYTKLTADCTKVLTACNQRMTEIKADVITFLKSCQQQNMKLIEKIPEQKRKFSWKDLIIYFLSGVWLIGMLMQIFYK